jgi:hypothetical protein
MKATMNRFIDEPKPADPLDETRRRFEAWAFAHQLHSDPDPRFPGRYNRALTNIAWEAWRAALDIKAST